MRCNWIRDLSQLGTVAALGFVVVGGGFFLVVLFASH